jgi:hypothetical protein
MRLQRTVQRNIVSLALFQFLQNQNKHDEDEWHPLFVNVNHKDVLVMNGRDELPLVPLISSAPYGECR